MKYLILVLLVLSCGKPKPAAKSIHDNPELDTKASNYAHMITKHQDSHGFLTIGCDSLLFTSLLAAVTDMDIDVTAARDSSGAWHRQPDKRCFPLLSKSEISRDMLIGVMFWAVYKNKLEPLESMRDYGKSHNWIMGEGDRTRTTFSANLYELLDESIAYVKGDKFKGSDYLFATLPVTGFEAHLQTLNILMVGKMRGKITGEMFKALQRNLKRNPRNALFQYAVAKYSHGIMTAPIATLLKEELFPTVILPNSTQRCTEYLWQREDDSDWMPCPGRGEEHTGMDLLFVYGLIKNG